MNHAVQTLERRLDGLTNGINSIGEQLKNIATMRENLERAETTLEESELAVVQINAALASLAVNR